jgi:putative DeoR family transcriptional regulator (stage III sporulation protein D)
VAAAKYIMDTKSTVRETARVFGVSKSTVHKDVTERLPRVNPSLAEEVKKVLEYNKAERHIRGGKATREKYRKTSKKCQYSPCKQK